MNLPRPVECFWVNRTFCSSVSSVAIPTLAKADGVGCHVGLVQTAGVLQRRGVLLDRSSRSPVDGRGVHVQVLLNHDFERTGHETGRSLIGYDPIDLHPVPAWQPREKPAAPISEYPAGRLGPELDEVSVGASGAGHGRTAEVLRDVIVPDGDDVVEAVGRDRLAFGIRTAAEVTLGPDVRAVRAEFGQKDVVPTVAGYGAAPEVDGVGRG